MVSERTFKDLTEAEREAFVERFYELWRKEWPDITPDCDEPGFSGDPWGCPWDYSPYKKAASADDWFAGCRDEIASYFAE